MQVLTQESHMNRALCLPALLLTAGCALHPGGPLGPAGKPVTQINGMSTAVAYDKARRACPNGYSIVEEPREKGFIDYEMSVECK